MDAKKLKSIIEILEGTDISVVEWKKADESLTIKRGPDREALANLSAVAVQLAETLAACSLTKAMAEPSANGSSSEAAHAKTQHRVSSPFVGTFYRSRSPDSPSLVKEGDRVTRGQTLCIVEAMKLMNEIEAEAEGRVTAILAENGQAVEYGEPLFEIEPA